MEDKKKQRVWHRGDNFYIQSIGTHYVEIVTPTNDPAIIDVDRFRKLLQVMVEIYQEGFEDGVDSV